ncbi:MAG: hypothetical protein AB7H71_00905 [Alphaproteobacteria bacterium]|jgi:hypothetical protein
MKKTLMGLAVLPFLAGAAVAAEPLNNQQMDWVTAGFSALANADAEGLVGANGIIATTTATLAQVNPIARATLGEGSSVLFKSISAAQSSTVSSTFTPAPIPGTGAGTAAGS